MPHIHEHYDFVVTVIIVYQDKVLLVHHPKYDRWLPMGGHIELDEDPEEALFREIEEETGLEVEILSSKPEISSPENKLILTPNYVDVHPANLPHKHISFTYFARAKNDQAKLSDEHSEVQWLSLDALEDKKYDLSELVKFYCREAIILAGQ